MNIHKELFIEYAQARDFKHTTYMRSLKDELYYIDPTQQRFGAIYPERWIGRLITPEGKLVGGCLALDYSDLESEMVICGNDLDEVVSWSELDNWRRCPYCAHVMSYQLTNLFHDVFQCNICMYTTERSNAG